jgi:hypothetical protein
LIDPLGDRLQVNLGTEAEIREQGQRMRVMFFILAIPGWHCQWGFRALNAGHAPRVCLDV